MKIVEELIAKSDLFHQAIRFPIGGLQNRIEQVVSSDELTEKVSKLAQSTRPILHSSVANKLIPSYINYKTNFGSTVESVIYEHMSALEFCQRLLLNRPVVFFTASDFYLLQDGTSGQGGFDNLSTSSEETLSIYNYITYEEMQISALFSVSVPTIFINSGSRENKGRRGEVGTFQNDGVYIASVGCRFEKPERMEWAHMIVSSSQNTIANGYGQHADVTAPQTQLLRVWSQFYCSDEQESGMYFPTYDEVESLRTSNSTLFNARYVGLDNTFQVDRVYFDKSVFKKRMRLVIEPFLLEASEKAGSVNKKAFVRAVGLGLGVWSIHPIQKELLIDVYGDVLTDVFLPHISDIDFMYFGAHYRCGGVNSGTNFVHTKSGAPIKIHFTDSNPADPVDGDKLLVAQYAWDGNAYPGNEYWLGSLSASGDPAAACCSLISELQNPSINRDAFSPDRFKLHSSNNVE